MYRYWQKIGEVPLCHTSAVLTSVVPQMSLACACHLSIHTRHQLRSQLNMIFLGNLRGLTVTSVRGKALESMEPKFGWYTHEEVSSERDGDEISMHMWRRQLKAA